MSDFINESDPLVFVEGDTAYGVQINEPWNTPTLSSTAVFHIDCLTVSPVTSVSPFDGQSATVTQSTSGTPLTTFQYSWPSALPEGTYRAYFTGTVSGSNKLFSTGDYLIVVKAP